MLGIEILTIDHFNSFWGFLGHRVLNYVNLRKIYFSLQTTFFFRLGNNEEECQRSLQSLVFFSAKCTATRQMREVNIEFGRQEDHTLSFLSIRNFSVNIYRGA